MAGGTGYEPLNIPKPVAEGIWVVDGPAIRFYGMPFSTRATIVRLESGGLFVHSPTKWEPGLRDAVAALGEVHHLIAPNWIHYAYVAEWQDAFPKAQSWAAPGVADRAASRGLALRFDHELATGQTTPWQHEIRQMVVPGSKVHREAVFLHNASRSLILTDLIENFEPAKLPFWMGWITRMVGIAAPKGRIPPDMKATFDKKQLAAAIEELIAWAPERVIVSHGAWFEENGAGELKRAFASVLRRR